MRENRTSGSMRGGRKRATSRRACALLYKAPHYGDDCFLIDRRGNRSAGVR